MLKVTLLILMTLVHVFVFGQSETPIYKDKAAPIEERIVDLVSKMTLEEKVLQLNQYTLGINTNENNIGEMVSAIPPGIGSLIYFGDSPEIRNAMQKMAMEESRLGIPVLFGFDVIHGFRTVYPISLGQACSWNLDLVERAAQVAAKEAKASGVDWTFSPMIDVARDGRWGRISECYGEDVYANAMFGVATVKGYQGSRLSDEHSIAACLKHYVGYGESEGGRDYRYTDISAQALWETYLPPYEACVKAGAATLMSGFNDISGVPASANHYTLSEILKEKWDHDGFVVSDWNSINQLINQGVAKDGKDAAYKAFMAGVEMDMVDKLYLKHLAELVDEGHVLMSQLDDAVSRILRVKFQLGLFDKPYTSVVKEENRYLKEEYLAVAEQLAEESIVLLKNSDNTLPIAQAAQKIAVIGPMAKDQENLLGSWAHHGKKENVVSIYEGLSQVFKSNANLLYSKGCNLNGDDESGFSEAVNVASQADVIVVCLGEDKRWSGENGTRSTIALPAIQEKLVKALKEVGKPIVLVLSSGRPLELIRLEPLADAMIAFWQPGIAGGNPLARIISGETNPSGKLSVTFPLATGQIPVYYNMRQSARPTGGQGDYQDISTDPLYWMGHGLSYTTYSYAPVKLEKTHFSKEESIHVELTVSNTGDMNGDESVLWYISDPYCSISRPMKELKFFEKKTIKVGESVVYEFEINPERDLSYVNARGERFLENGTYYIHVGTQKIKFELVN